MKKLFYFFLLIFSFSLNYSQVAFWTETFGAGCSQGSTPATLPNPGGMGNWTTSYLNGYVPNVSSGSDEFFISATETQTTSGSCSSSCLASAAFTDRSLHIGNLGGGAQTPLCPGGDCGSLYNAAVSATLQAESPVISTVGQNNVSLSFDYIEFGAGTNDDAEVYYRIGAGPWTFLTNPPKTNCGTTACAITPCNGFQQAIWANVAVPMPAATWNVPAVQVAFLWKNNGDNSGTDPSFAVDNVKLLAPASWTPAFSLVTPTCSGTSQGATVTVNPATVAIAGYTWSSSPAGPTFSNPNASPTSITFPGAGTFSITVTTSVSGQGTASSTQTIQIDPTPTVNITASSASVCVGGSSTLTANSSGATSWSWNPTTGLSPTTGSVVVASPTTPTDYTVTAVNGVCTATAAISIGISPALSLTVSANPSSVCSGGSSTLTVAGATSYVWSPSSSLNTPNGPVVIATPSTTTNYQVVGTSGSCTGTANISVAVTGALPVNVSPSSATICPGGNVVLQASGGNTYTWTPSGSLSSSNGSTVTATPSSNTTYTVVGAIGTCTGQATVPVVIGSPLTVSISPATATTCIGGPSATLVATGASNYQWTPTVGLLFGNTGPVVFASPTITTTYSVLGTAGSCTGTAVRTVTVLPYPNMTISPTSTVICYGTSYTYSANGVFSYTWAPPTPSANVFIVPIDTNFAQVVLSPTVTTTYTVTGQNLAGCPTLPQTVTLNVVPIPTATAALLTNTLGVNTNSMCGFTYNTATLSVGTSPLPTGIGPFPSTVGPYHYQWTPTVDLFGTVDNDSIYNIPFSLKNACTPGYKTTFTVTAYYELLPGCKATDTTTLRVVNCYSPTPRTPTSAGFIQVPANDTLCEKQCTVLKNNFCGGDTMSVFWYIPGAVPDTITSRFPVTICFPVAPYEYTVTMNITNPYGSVSWYSQPKNYIHVVDTPDAVRASADPVGIRDTCIRYGSCLPLHALHMGPNTYVSWFPPENLSNRYSPTPIACPTVNTTYILTAYNSYRCRYYDTLNVCVEPDCGEMYIPNAFSPNSDGQNDILYVRGKCLTNMILMIFNRWGEKVFESHDQNYGWDGTFNGVLMNTGVFVYRLEGTTFEGEPYSKKGNITLMR